MKLTFLLLFMTTTLIAVQFTSASPVQVVQAFNDGSKSNEVARQQTVSAAAAPAPVADDDDDDDEDDDDDLDILDDDDEDDDDEGRFCYFN